MTQLPTRRFAHLALAAALVAMFCAPDLALAQASPFMTGASSLQTNILAWLTPVAIILVMVLGGMAMANRRGRTLLAAAARLREAFPDAQIRAFALLRTRGLISDIQSLLEPCRGQIRWMDGDARRIP